MTMEDCSLDKSDWETIKKHELVLTGPRDVNYYREAFLKPLTDVIGKVSDTVLSFGPLGKPWEWWLTLKTESSRDKLLLAGALKVGKGGHLFHVRSAAKTQFVVRVHWAPPFISNKYIAGLLAKHCKVVIWAPEYCVTDGFQKCTTGVRQIMCEGNKCDVPHTISIACPFTGATFEILCTITGRKPICLRCRMEGHVRRDCVTPRCRHHGTYGHTSESCAGLSSRGKWYASAASGESAPVERDRQTGAVGASVPGASARGPAAVGVTVAGVAVAAGCEPPPPCGVAGGDRGGRYFAGAARCGHANVRCYVRGNGGQSGVKNGFCRCCCGVWVGWRLVCVGEHGLWRG